MELKKFTKIIKNSFKVLQDFNNTCKNNDNEAIIRLKQFKDVINDIKTNQLNFKTDSNLYFKFYSGYKHP